MAQDPVAASQASDGQWKIAFLPSTETTPLSVAKLNGATSKALTYSFTADGFNRSISQASVDDKRLTLTQDLSRPGRIQESIEIKYVDSSDTASADAVLTSGVSGFLVLRRGVANATTWTIGDKVDLITFQAGQKRPDAPNENGVDTISQTLYVTAPTQFDAVLVA